MKKDSINLETYESTIAQIAEMEKPLVTKGIPPTEDERESEKAQLIQGDGNTEQPTPTFNLERKSKDRVQFFSVDRKLVETANCVLDESTMVFRKTRGCESGAGADILNQDVRESIEHWLDTSGGFEYLDSYNSAGEEIIFEREESTNSMKRNATLSMTTRVSERNFPEETRLNKLTLPSSEMEVRRLSTSRTTMFEGIAKGLRGDLVGTSRLPNADVIQCSSDKNEEFPLRIASYNDDDRCSGLSAYPSLGDTFGISKGSDQIVREFPPQEPAHVDLLYSEAQMLYGTGTPTIPCMSTVPALTEGMTLVLTNDKRLHDQGVQTLVPELPSLEFSSPGHDIGSAKSSREDWPKYKCLAELKSGSETLGEDEHWLEYNGINEQEDGKISEGVQIEEFPVDQIPTTSTSEVEVDEKSLGGTIQPQVAAVRTRPLYSAVHSMRAAERQPIDFPGISSLAFGYQSPRPHPPPLKPVGQTSIDMSSVSVQTSDMPMPQPAPLSTSVFVVPFYGFPPYTMYIPSPASAVPSQGSEVSMRSATLTEQAQKLFGTDWTDFRLQYHHNDAILKLPEDLQVLASNNVTQYQSLVSYKPANLIQFICRFVSYCEHYCKKLRIRRLLQSYIYLIFFCDCMVAENQFKASHFLTFCGHPDYSHNPEILKELLEYDKEKLWVHEQLIEYGLATAPANQL